MQIARSRNPKLLQTRGHYLCLRRFAVELTLLHGFFASTFAT